MKTNQSHDIENQRWLSPNNHIGGDGNVCPKNIGIYSIALLKNKTIVLSLFGSHNCNKTRRATLSQDG